MARQFKPKPAATPMTFAWVAGSSPLLLASSPACACAIILSWHIADEPGLPEGRKFADVKFPAAWRI
jgi:hypothetical protein